MEKLNKYLRRLKDHIADARKLKIKPCEIINLDGKKTKDKNLFEMDGVRMINSNKNKFNIKTLVSMLLMILALFFVPNVSEATAVFDDMTPPTGTIEVIGNIIDGVSYVNDANVVLKLTASDNVTATENLKMKIYNETDYKNIESLLYVQWDDFEEEVPWKLEPGDGYKVIYMILKDEEGNVSLNISENLKIYTITFKTKGGTEIEQIAVPAGVIITPPLDPTKEGYTFVGWDKEIPRIMPAEDITITAIWEINEYTITFDTDGGNTIDPITADYGTRITAPQDPTKEGHTFIGWDKEIPKAMPAENITIKAKWEVNEYTITFDTDGGSTIKPITADYGTSIILPSNPTKEGYNFMGWDKEIPKTMPAENMTIKAIWSIKTYSVKYDANEGTISGDNSAGATRVVTHFKTYGEAGNGLGMPIATRTGYNFVGWFTDKTAGREIKADTVVDGTANGLILYARWTIVNYNISYDLAGGAVETENPTSYTIESATITLNNPTRTGYTFAGWTGTGLSVATTTVTIVNGSTGNRSYTATWTPITYTIAYDLAGGTVSGNPTTYTIESGDITLNEPTREGYTFAGWTGTDLASATKTVTIASGSIGNRNYTATWTPNHCTYNIRYVSNSGKELGTDTITQRFNTTNTVSPIDITGYTKPASQEIKWDSINPKTITFKYTPITYTITYNTDATLPTGYTKLDYIEGTGTQYIYTGAAGEARWEMDIQFTNTTKRQLMGYAGSASEYWGVQTDGKYGIWSGGTIEVMAGERDTIIHNYGEGGLYYLEVVGKGYRYVGVVDVSSVEYKLFTIGGDWNSKAAQAKMYGARAIQNGKLIRDYVPAKNSSGVAGLYDLVNGVFYPSTGATAFVAGPESSTTAYTGTIIYTIESPTITLPTPTKEGFTFLGWTGSNGSTAQTTVKIDAGSIGDKTYTANWKEHKLYISYYSNYATSAFSGALNAVGADKNVLTRTWVVPYTYGADATGLHNYTGSTDSNYLARTGYKGTGYWGTTEAGGTKVHQDTGWSSTEEAANLFGKSLKMGDVYIYLYAQWELETYTITYNLAGGAVETANPTSYTIKSTAITLNNPTREGYTFAGWTGTGLSSATKTVTIAAGSTGNRNYTATWTPINYSITYYLNGGAVSGNPTSYTTESTAITLNNPTKTGYTFAGWTGTGLSGATKTVKIPTGSTGNKSYTANWTAVTYTISYDLAGGSVATANPTSYTIESSAITLNNPTRNGYTFAGWTGTGLSAATKTVTIAAGSTENRNYTATWTPINYSITYYLNGGAVSGNPTSYTTESTAITLNNPTKTGYTFAGWTGTGLSGATKTVTIAKGSIGNRSYTATWTPNTDTKYIVYHYLENAEDINYTLQSEEEKKGTTDSTISLATLSKVITNGTYAFGSLTESGSQATEVKIAPDGSTKVYLYYSRNTATLTLAKGSYIATVSGGGTYKVGKKVTITATLMANDQGYTNSFTGWTSQSTVNIVNPTSLSAVVDMPASNVTVTANATRTANNNTPYVVYHYLENPNDAGYTLTRTENKTGTTDSTLTLANLKTTITNGTYSKGSLTEDGSEATSTTIAANGSTKIYLYYTRNKYTLTVAKGNHIESTSGTGSYKVGATVAISATLGNEAGYKYVFAGWTGDATFADSSALSTTIVMPAANVIVTAVGARNGRTYSITYDLAGGSVATANPTSYTAESAAITLNNPTRTGYEFAGWTETVTIPNWYDGFLNYDTGLVQTGASVGYASSVYSERIYLQAGVKYTLSGTSLGDIRWRVYNTSGTYTGSISGAEYTPSSDCYASILLYQGCTAANRTAMKVIATYGVTKLTWNSGFLNIDTGAVELNNTTYPNSVYSEPIFLRGGLTHTITGTSLGGVRWRTYNLDGTFKANASSEMTYTPTEDCFVRILLYEGCTAANRNAAIVTSRANKNITIKTGSAGNRTYEAKWIAKSVTVKFMRNHSSSDTTSATQVFTYGKTGQAFAAKGWTKTGYDALGWSHSSTATSKTYDVLSGVSDSWINSYSPTTTLYIIWKATTYSISYDFTSDNLPSGYTPLRYIESTGTQYINTGIAENAAYGIKMNFQVTGTAVAWQSLLSGTLDNFTVGTRNTDTTGFYIRLRTAEVYNAGGSLAAAGNELTIKDGVVYVNGNQLATYTHGALSTASSSMILFSNSTQSRYGKMRLYGLEIYDSSGNVSRNFLPCKNSSGTIGLYDTVQGKFYANNGSGTFTAGPALTLPSGYKQLSYIQSTGTQYIDTGYKPTNATRVIMEFQQVGTTFGALYGGRTNTTEAVFGTWIEGGTIYPHYGNISYNNYPISATTTNKFIYEQNAGYAAVAGGNASSSPSASFTSSYSLALLTMHDSTGFDTRRVSGKLYSAKIYNGTTLVRDFVPCINSSNAVGLYDLVEGKFYANAGTGAFTASETYPTTYTTTTSVTLPKPTRSGYTFTGWTGSNGTTPQTTVTIATGNTGNKSYKANWTPISYAISYDEELPAGYTKVEYIQSTGTQYIKTGVIDEGRWEVDIQFTDTTTRQLMGYGGAGAEYWGVQTNGYYGKNTSEYVSYKAGNRDLVIHNYGENGQYYIEVAGSRANMGVTDVSSKEYYLFTIIEWINGTCVKSKLYGARAIQNGVLVRNFVPCINASGAVGLYDTVEGKFYGNSGTGNFIAGTVDAELPAGYKQVEYIQSTGTQWLDTGVTVKSTLVSHLKFNMTEVTGGVIYGNVNSATGDTNDYRLFNHAGSCYLDFPNSSRIYGGTMSAGVDYEVEVGNYYVKNLTTGTNIISGTAVTFSEQTNTLKLWLNESANNSSSGKLYYLRIYDNGKMLRNFVPCINASGAAGLYDTVEGKFYGNAGTGTFTTGAVRKVALPTGYRQVEYLKSTGTQWINSGAPIGANTWVDTELMFDSAFDYNMMFGAWSDLSVSLRATNVVCAATGGTGSQNIGSTTTTGVKYNIVLGPGMGYRQNGVTTAFGGASNAGSGRTILLFAASDGSTGNNPYAWTSYGVGKIYSFKIYNGTTGDSTKSTLVRDFVPCVNASGVPGMYDLLEGKFYANQGTGSFTTGGVSYQKSYTTEDAPITLPTLSRTNYDFLGWTGSNGTTPQTTVTIPTGSLGNKEYHANWKIKAVSYKVNHYQENITDTNYTLKETENLTAQIGASVTPTVKSYTGFTSPATQTVTIAADGSTVVNYYYTRITYYLDLNGVKDGTSGGDISGYGTADVYVNGTRVAAGVSDYWTAWKYGSTYEIKNAVATTGHVYNGVHSGAASGTITGATSVYLSFSIATYTNTVNHVVYGGSGSNYKEIIFAQSTFTAAYGSTITLNGSHKTTPPNGTNVSHYGTAAFAGSWTAYYVSNATNVTQPANAVGISLYYSATTYSVTYNLNGGTNASSNKTSYTVMDGFTLSDPTRTGYTFAGWTNASGTKITSLNGGLSNDVEGSQVISNFNSRIAGNQALTANWTANTYYVTYDANGGTGAPAQQAFAFDSGAKISTTVPTRNGYTFLHWLYSGTTFAPGAAIPSGYSNFTLVAQWTPNKIKITLNPNGGSGGTTQFWYIYGTSKFYSNEACTTEITAITRPTRTGYTYVHYAGDGTCGGTNGERYVAYDSTEFAGDLATDIYKDATLYASWTANTYQVTYEYGTNLISGLNNIGSTTNDGLVYSISNGVITARATRNDGYAFIGGKVYLEAGVTYTFNCNVNGTWGSNSAQTEAYLMLNGEYNHYYHLSGNSNFQFTPTTTGTYHLRLDVNANGDTRIFSNVRITRPPIVQNVTYGSTYGSMPTPTKANIEFVGWFAENSTSARDSSKKYRAHPWLYYADAYGDLYNAFGYNEANLRNHFINNGNSEGRRKAQYISTDTYNVAGNQTLYAGWHSDPDMTAAKYSVWHYQQNTSGSGYTVASVVGGTGAIGASVTATVNNYAGFNLPSAQTVTIAWDGSTRVEYYYTRKTYTVTVNAGTDINSVSGGGTYYYGSSVTVSASVPSGYIFAGWSGTHSSSSATWTFSMPATNVDITAKALKTVTITYQKTAQINWAYATIQTNLVGQTGPVTGDPNYLHTAVTVPSGVGGVTSSLNWGVGYTSESGRNWQSVDLGWFGSYRWQKPGSDVYGYSDVQTLTVPVGTTLTFTLNNHYFNGGEFQCEIYNTNSTSGTIWGPGQSKNIGTYTYTVNSNINIRANWKTDGEYVPGLTDIGEYVTDYIGFGSVSDDRDSWWDVHIY